MADAVQQIMEQMLPELEDLIDKGIFSQNEAKQIIQKRRNFEYQMNRRALRKIDVLRYVSYEQNLDTLRSLRKEGLGIKKGSVSDSSGTRRVHFIFNRALKRFRFDVKLWFQYFDFCIRSKSAKLLSKAFSQALQLHPHNTALWIRAASWEFQQNQNVNNARMLLQRAIRINKGDQHL